MKKLQEQIVEPDVQPQRSMRVDDSLWEAAMEKAKSQDLTLSQVIRHFLKGYVDEPKPKRRKASVD